jgi:hypothetical protein
MKTFAIGDRVIIRHGQQRGRKAVIMEVQSAEIYKVRLPDGSFLLYSISGLERGDEEALPSPTTL